MKKLFLFFTFLSLFTNAQNPVEHIGVKGPLKFDGQTYNLSWSDKPAATYFIQEYLPANENMANFVHLMTIHLFVVDMSTRDAANSKIKELEARKKTDPVCNYQVTESPDGKEYMVDFLLSESKNDEMTIVEFNIYRFVQVDLGNGKKAIEVYAYSKRSYGDDITPFLKNLASDRTNMLNEMITAKVPEIKLTGK